MKSVLVFFVLCLVLSVFGLMLNSNTGNECPREEFHKSCHFFEEYTCWENSDRYTRVMNVPKKLVHCVQGCFCKKGFVREYPHGRCIQGKNCKDKRLEFTLNALPTNFGI